MSPIRQGLELGYSGKLAGTIHGLAALGPPIGVAVFLISLAQYSFLAFHTFAELFAIVISFLIFTVAWSARYFEALVLLIAPMAATKKQNGYFLVTGFGSSLSDWWL